METDNYIQVEQFCTYHGVEVTFINALQDYGLIDVVVIEQDNYLAHEQVKNIEKMMRLHYDMDINFEGIDVITNLLEKVDKLQQELNATRNRLRFFER